jgi:hypothetical protein
MKESDTNMSDCKGACHGGTKRILTEYGSTKFTSTIKTWIKSIK